MNPQFNSMPNIMPVQAPNMMFSQNQNQNMMYSQNQNMMQGQMPNMGNFYQNSNFNQFMPCYQNQNMFNNPNMMMGMQYCNPSMGNMYMAYPVYGGIQGNTSMMPNNVNNNINNNNNNANQKDQSLLSRDNRLIGDPNLPTGQGYINVFFEASTGNTVVLNLKDDIGLRDALKQYMNKIQLSESYIGTQIVFLFNGRKLDHESNEPIKTFKIGNSSKITVFDQGNVIGA
jgi:hypothetical protein